MAEEPRDETVPQRGLDAFFAAEQRAAKPVPPVLISRILEDAARVQNAHIQTVFAPAPAWWRRFAAWTAVIGGWPAVATLVTATLAGVWIGTGAPVGFGMGLGTSFEIGVDSALQSLLGREADSSFLVDVMPQFDGFLSEGTSI